MQHSYIWETLHWETCALHVQNYARDVGDVVRIRNGVSLVYSLHTLAFLGASAACLFVPDATLAAVFGYSR